MRPSGECNPVGYENERPVVLVAAEAQHLREVRLVRGEQVARHCKRFGLGVVVSNDVAGFEIPQTS